MTLLTDQYLIDRLLSPRTDMEIGMDRDIVSDGWSMTLVFSLGSFDGIDCYAPVSMAVDSVDDAMWVMKAAKTHPENFVLVDGENVAVLDTDQILTGAVYFHYLPVMRIDLEASTVGLYEKMDLYDGIFRQPFSKLIPSFVDMPDVFMIHGINNPENIREYRTPPTKKFTGLSERLGSALETPKNFTVEVGKQPFYRFDEGYILNMDIFVACPSDETYARLVMDKYFKDHGYGEDFFTVTMIEEVDYCETCLAKQFVRKQVGDREFALFLNKMNVSFG